MKGAVLLLLIAGVASPLGEKRDTSPIFSLKRVKAIDSALLVPAA